MNTQVFLPIKVMTSQNTICFSVTDCILVLVIDMIPNTYIEWELYPKIYLYNHLNICNDIQLNGMKLTKLT